MFEMTQKERNRKLRKRVYIYPGDVHAFAI